MNHKDMKYIIGCFAISVMIIFAGLVWGAAGDPIIEERPGQTITGKSKVLVLAVNSAVTISGVSKEGVYITGASNAARAMTAGITVYVDSPVIGDSLFFFNSDDTSLSGNTLFVHFINSGTSVFSDTNCTSMVSKFIVSGTTFEKTITMLSIGTGVWAVKTSGSPDVEAD